MHRFLLCITKYFLVPLTFIVEIKKNTETLNNFPLNNFILCVFIILK